MIQYIQQFPHTINSFCNVLGFVEYLLCQTGCPEVLTDKLTNTSVSGTVSAECSITALLVNSTVYCSGAIPISLQAVLLYYQNNIVIYFFPYYKIFLSFNCKKSIQEKIFFYFCFE